MSIRDLTERTLTQFHADIGELGVLPPNVEPRATEHIAEMIALIERLIAAGHAYVAEGHVLFNVPSMPGYGKLSGRTLDEMIAGARVDVAPYKKDPTDFVLWKPSSKDLPGWESPWGRGRPGWHIECSAMSWKHLGEVFDIHGGGIDLVFPHHENEIAQTCCAFGQPVMANLWMHNGFLQVEGKKMSKSLGNFLTIRQLLDDWPGEVLRFNMLRTHYRQPIDWTVKGLEESHTILKGWYDRTDMAAAPHIEGDFGGSLARRPQHPARHRRAACDGGRSSGGQPRGAGFAGKLERANAPAIDEAKVASLIARAPPRVRRRISPRPTASAASSTGWASRSRTPRTPRRGPSSPPGNRSARRGP